MKTKFLIFPSILLGIVMSGCQKEESPFTSFNSTQESNSERTMSFVLDENTVGEYHNIKLEEMYSKMEARINTLGYNSIQKPHFRNSFKEIMNETFIGANNGNFKQFGLNEYDASIVATNIEDISASALVTINNSTASTEFKEFITEFIIEAQTKLSQNDKDQFCFQCYQKIALLNLSGVEAQIAIGTVNVFDSSFEYWTLNFGKWRDLINPNDDTPLSNETRAHIGAADAGGFAVGALWGAGGGTAVLPGVGTVSGWLGGGVAAGAGNSIGAAVSNFWEWLWS